MAMFEDLRFAPAAAHGAVRLFPLPNLVLFPQVVQPLHVFEPRYRELVEVALASDGLIAMGLLQPGWERDYEGRPQVWPVVCVGQILSHHRLPDGRFNLLLQGAYRAAIRRELPAATPFRQVEVDRLDDYYPTSGKAARPALQKRLADLARKLSPERSPVRKELDELLSNQISLGALCDVFAFSLSLPLSLKQRLLSEWNVDRRAQMLIERLTAQLEEQPPQGPNFPPPFSLN